MKRLVPLLVVLLLAGGLYVLLGDDAPPRYDDDYELDLLGGEPARDLGPLTQDEERPEGGRAGGGMLPEAPSKEDRARSSGIVFRGRVVDERRRPVADVKVHVRLGRRGAGGGVTDSSGHYEIPVTTRRMLRVLVVAEAEDGRGGTAAVWTTPGMSGPVGVPPIVLRPVTDLRIRVVHGAERSGAGGATCVIAQRSAGTPVALATHRTAGSGQLTVAGLPRGSIEVFAYAPGKGRGHARMTLPQLPGPPPEILLGGERQIDVYVVDAVTRRPVSGAEVLVGNRLSMPAPDGPGYLPPVGAVRTGASGRATVSGLGANDKVFVNARASGYALSPWWKHTQSGVAPDQREIEIALRGFRSVRFHVDAFAPETPPDGTALTLELDPQAARMAAPDKRAVLEDGLLVVEGLPDSAVRGTVRAADGVYAHFTAPARVTDGPPVVFRRARTVVVRLLTAEGEPAEGVLLALNLVPTGLRPLTATTDADGLAPFQDVGGSEASVHRARTDGRGVGAILAKLDLTEERETFEVELQPTTNLLLRMRVDGEPRLPSAYGLTIAGRPVPPEDLIEDPAAGTVLAPFDNPGLKRTIKVRIVPEGFLPAERGLAVDAGDIDHEITIDLEAEGSLIARITPPVDGQFGVSLEVRDDAGGWTHAPSGSGSGFHPVAGPGASVETRQFRGLPAGTYRVRDPRSGVESRPAQVEPGAAPATVTLDLSRVGWIEGRVVAPVGADLRRARVLVEGKDRATSAWAGAAVKEDGTFRVRVGADRATTLVVTHPTLRAARTGGRARVSGSDTAVVLRLERGGEAVFRIGVPRTEEMVPGGVVGTVSVRLFAGAARGDPLRVLQPVKDGDRYRFGGYEPGTYTLWINIGNRYAPILKKSIKLGDGTTDLGTLEPASGSTVRVRLRAGAARGATRLYVTAVRIEPPTYTRSASSRDAGGDAVCAGLGPGTYKISVRSLGMGGVGGGLLLEQEATLDGRSEKVIEVSGR